MALFVLALLPVNSRMRIVQLAKLLRLLHGGMNCGRLEGVPNH
jgi:hypothetical protein